MKKKIEKYLGGAFSLVETLIITATLALAFATPATSHAANYTAIQGQYIDGANDSVINAGGTAYTNDVILANSTNYFNLSSTAQSQSNTNLWPALCSPSAGLQSRFLSCDAFFKCVGANGGVVTFGYVVSPDGSLWLTNTPFILTVTANGTTSVTGGTNIDLSAHPFACLWWEANTNATIAVTNLTLKMVAKPNL